VQALTFLPLENPFFLDKQNQQQQRPEFQQYSTNDSIDLTPEQIMNMNSGAWSQPKEARVVPKEKAAFAYGQTVLRQIDPALAEWAGADVFNCRVFPLMSKKLHKIVIAYDVNLTSIENDKVFDFSIPKTKSLTTVDLNVAELNSSKLSFKNVKGVSGDANRKFAHLENPEVEDFSIRYSKASNIMISSNKENDKFFAATVLANLPSKAVNNKSTDAVLAIDISASSNPDKFNIWLKMADAILKNNPSNIKQFKVLFFNVEGFWWKPDYITNSQANRSALLNYMSGLSLRGATDIGMALTEASLGSEAKNIFILSDASATWGETELYSVSSKIGTNNRVFGFNTGMSGTDMNMLSHLARETGGAIFTVSGEDEIKKASTAHNSIPWEIKSVTMDGASDIIIAGRPKFIYPGQNLTIAGRGYAKKNATITLNLAQKGKDNKLNIKFSKFVESDLAKRVYGQIAVSQLENFGYPTENFSIPYAVHFAVPGKTCSMLMLETQEDYKQFNINKEEHGFVVNENPVNGIVRKTLEQLSSILGNAKAAFMNSLTKLTKTQGVTFEVSQSLKTILGKMPDVAFEISPKALSSKKKNKSGISKKLTETLIKSRPEYDILVNEAKKLKNSKSADDALILLSTLVERNPSDGVMARDIAYSAMEWGLTEQAYFLFKRVLASRPHEPQTYHAIAQILTEMNKIDLAVIYYEIAISAQWDFRFGEFRNIASLDYLRLLRQIESGKYSVHFPEYTKARISSIEQIVNVQSADIIITISWNTDNTDIDLHVIEPSGEECFYGHPETKSGGKLTKDVTQGYGPEMYVLKNAESGKFKVKAKYYSSNRNRASTRTKVYAVIYENWGKPNEKITKKVVSLADKKDMHDILTLMRGQ